MLNLSSPKAFFKSTLKSVMLIPLVLLTSCFKMEGVHLIDYYGNSDTGTYSMFIPQLVIATNPEIIQDISDRLESSVSKPGIRFTEDGVYLEDYSGNAVMENMYDSWGCDRSTLANGTIECSYYQGADLSSAPGWEVRWAVVLRPGIEIISSNHHRTERYDGKLVLIWQFDYTTHSAYNIDLRIKTPVAN